MDGDYRYISYRYFDQIGAVATLRTKLLRLSKISDLNDPFEHACRLDDFLPHEGSRVENYNIIRQCIDDLKASYYVCCFSWRYDIPSMWSHYAVHKEGLSRFPHGGVVVGFIRLPKITRMREVAYKTKPPQITFRRKVDDMMDLVVTKHVSWSYEEEFRIFLPIDSAFHIRSLRRKCDKEYPTTEQDGKSYRNIPISPGDIHCVIFGANIKDHIRDELMSVLETQEYRHVEICGMRIDPYKSYKPIKYTIRKGVKRVVK